MHRFRSRERDDGLRSTACAEQERLHAERSQALQAIIEIHGSQIAAVNLGDTRTSPFEEQIRMAADVWAHAHRAYLQHCAEHGCSANLN